MTKNKATINALNGSKIDLNHKLQNLEKQYVALTQLIFSSDKNKSELINQRHAIIKYLGADFYHQALIAYSNNKNRSNQLLGRNKSVIVTFSDYHVNNNSIDLVIYTTFALKKRIQNQKTGLAYLTVNYNLTKDKATNTQIQLATSEANK
ncbi:hypothetical protein [Lactobacillus crispatus]|jgi:hypothetical protein|uniref:Conjugal transfer protein n=1 Tax=Lactobacillus crispatus TaxID=47770 RepID=A0AAW8WM80_9LACO|nr:hypothetical protein [Lactobacillus crispatus]STX18398.1 Uncharacterised protein [Lactobacillus acidophilus]MCT7696527.1 hypothetical protein [Lactobacillus crispatus]MCT7707989.1 hypothetical protein [Lactobacillus crispatus]MCZ3784566.1 hypothetical protein [Lactobacillus crispatus]MCZ3792190.1 hypothetical protein [Lactobacillus crispatus]